MGHKNSGFSCVRLALGIDLLCCTNREDLSIDFKKVEAKETGVELLCLHNSGSTDEEEKLF